MMGAEAQRDELENISDQDIEEFIRRLTNSLRLLASNLADKGESIRVSIKRYEDEKERRRLRRLQHQQREELEKMSDQEIEEFIRRQTNSLRLLASKLADEEENIRVSIKRLEDEKERRRLCRLQQVFSYRDSRSMDLEVRHADGIKRAMLINRCGVGGGARARRRRSWNDMNHDILVNIMLRLGWKEWVFTVCYISKSWLSALLDALFPAGNQELDLHRLLSINGVYFRRRFRHYINLILDRRTQPVWTKLILPNNHERFGEQFYHFLCERLPSLRVLIVPKPQERYVEPLPRLLVPYWKNLREVHTRSTMVLDLSVHCKYIYHLSLYGPIENLQASRIATGFPLLKCLVLQSASLSMNALSVILDGHKNLELLDTRHCHRISDEDLPTKSWVFSMVFRPTIWNEEEILHKASGVKTHLQCARQHCPECSHLYINFK